jgi:hypothetical protein
MSKARAKDVLAFKNGLEASKVVFYGENMQRRKIIG